MKVIKVSDDSTMLVLSDKEIKRLKGKQGNRAPSIIGAGLKVNETLSIKIGVCSEAAFNSLARHQVNEFNKKCVHKAKQDKDEK